MPATEQALALTDLYRGQLTELRGDVLRALALAWQTIDPDALGPSYAAWMASTLAGLTVAQRAGIALTEAYLAQFVSAELGRLPRRPERSLADKLAGRSSAGQPLAKTLQGPLATVAVALGQGRGRARALEMGQARASRIVAVEVLAAPRAALADGLEADPRIAGWKRVTGADACLACLGAATGAVHPTSDALDVHGFCRCTKEPVVRGVLERRPRPTGRERFDALTPAQQDARYGPEKAELLRTGAVELEQLVKPQRMTRTQDEITERPLGELHPR